MDVIVRLYGDQLSQALGKPVVIENKPGGLQMMAVNAVLPAPADGYSLLAMTSAGAAINKSLVKNTTYDTARDFVPLSLYVKSPFILVVDPKLPIKSVNELVKYAKDHPGQLSYSSSGTGGVPHLVFELLKQRFESRHHARALQEQSAIDRRYRRWSREHGVRRGGRFGSADQGRQAARARGFLGRAPADGRRRRPVSRSIGRKGLRSRVLARIVRAQRHAGANRHQVARRNGAHHEQTGHPAENHQSRA